jgi:hypothetical protein
VLTTKQDRPPSAQSHAIRHQRNQSTPWLPTNIEPALLVMPLRLADPRRPSFR